MIKALLTRLKHLLFNARVTQFYNAGGEKAQLIDELKSYKGDVFLFFGNTPFSCTDDIIEIVSNANSQIDVHVKRDGTHIRIGKSTNIGERVYYITTKLRRDYCINYIF